jgi:hypothetical protein
MTDLKTMAEEVSKAHFGAEWHDATTLATRIERALAAQQAEHEVQVAALDRLNAGQKGDIEQAERTIAALVKQQAVAETLIVARIDCSADKQIPKYCEVADKFRRRAEYAEARLAMAQEREQLISAAALAVAQERQGKYEGAARVADFVIATALAPSAEPSNE